MFDGVKNFAVEKVLRHVAGDQKLDAATNVLAIIPPIALALANSGADWVKLANGDPKQLALVGGVVVATALLWLTGKFPGLKEWLPVAEEVIAEAEAEAGEVKK